jgi:hypothetical protein
MTWAFRWQSLSAQADAFAEANANRMRIEAQFIPIASHSPQLDII